MTHPKETSHQPRRRRADSTSWMLWATLAVVAALGAAAGTMALWNETSAWPEAHFVTSGDLSVTATGDPVWHETSSDVTSEPRVIDPEAFLIRAGDSVSADFPFETTLTGDNMAAELSVDWDTDTRIPDSVSGRYSIFDEQGTELTSSATVLGDETVLDLTPPAGADQTAAYTVQVHLDFAGLDDRFGADSVDQLDDLGDLTIELHQVRPGDEAL